MCAFALPGENGTHEIGVKVNKKHKKHPPNITDFNWKNDDQILIVFGTSISNTTGCSSYHLTQHLFLQKKTEQSTYALKTSTNFISPDLWPPTTLTSVRSLTMFAVSCSSESIGRCLGMSMNSESEWLKSGAEHYRHCYQWIEKASAWLCWHKGPIFRIFSVSSWTTGQLDKLSAKVTEI